MKYNLYFKMLLSSALTALVEHPTHLCKIRMQKRHSCTKSIVTCLYTIQNSEAKIREWNELIILCNTLRISSGGGIYSRGREQLSANHRDQGYPGSCPILRPCKSRWWEQICSQGTNLSTSYRKKLGQPFKYRWVFYVGATVLRCVVDEALSSSVWSILLWNFHWVSYRR